VAFDPFQKAVITSCSLRYKPVLQPSGGVAPAGGGAGGGANGQKHEGEKEERLINCCFSFTIRRDKWGMPSMIVGNFMKC
jgi:hypothetical protein